MGHASGLLSGAWETEVESGVVRLSRLGGFGSASTAVGSDTPPAVSDEAAAAKQPYGWKTVEPYLRVVAQPNG
jgi:hypothetical protein